MKQWKVRKEPVAELESWLWIRFAGLEDTHTHHRLHAHDNKRACRKTLQYLLIRFEEETITM